MRLTKLVHSCLLVEADNKKVLVDPGIYSWNSGVVDKEHLKNLDAVVVTHAHPDHLNQAFAEAIQKSSPDAAWYGPQEVVDQLKAWGIKGNITSEDSAIEFVESEHANLSPWFDAQPDHTSFALFGDLLVGGDCHTLTDGRSVKVFGAAVNGGPWGGVVGFAKMIENMTNRPEVVIPLHDWHWQDDARQAIYSKLPDVLGKFNVTFRPLRNGETEEI